MLKKHNVSVKDLVGNYLKGFHRDMGMLSKGNELPIHLKEMRGILSTNIEDKDDKLNYLLGCSVECSKKHSTE